MPPQPPLGHVPRQARGRAARQRIYEVALAQFAADGVDDARVEDVVSAAGVSWGTFFRYFPRKQDVLLEAAVQHFRGHVLPAAETGLADPDRPAQTIALALMRSILLPVDQPAVLHGEIVREVIDRRERFAAMTGSGAPPIINLVMRIVVHGQQRGEVRTDLDALTLTAVLSSAVVFTVLMGYYDPLRTAHDPTGLPDVAGLIDRSFSVAWRGLQPA